METASTLADKTTDCAQPYTPSPAEVEANAVWQRQRSIEFALQTTGGISISAEDLVSKAKVIDTYIAGSTGTTNT